MPSGSYIKSKEQRKKMSNAHKGKKKPWVKGDYWNGKKMSIKIRKKMSLSAIGKHKGEKCHFWKGGISFEPYSMDWTIDLKRAIRKRDKYTCQVCGKEPSIYCHHIDYDKKNCNLFNLITLCHSCHSKTNHNRDYWINYFKGL